MKTESLTFFLDLAQTGSLSQTAEHFFTSHQVISKAIKNLEDELNVKLITTSNQGATLTDAGQVLLKYATLITNTITELQAELEPWTIKTSSPRKKIYFCTSPYLTDSLILSFVDDYQERNPEITFELTSLPFSSIIPEIKSPNAVFIIPTIESATQEKHFISTLNEHDLTFFVLAERPIYICTHHKSPLATYDFITEDMLAKIPLIISSNITLNMVFAGNQHRQLVNSISAQKNLIRRGNGVGIYTKAEFDYYFRNEKNFILIPAEMIPVQYICIRQKNSEIPEHVHQFLTAIRQCF